MCGIAGLASLDGRTPADPAALDAMSATLRHRGPDADGVLLDGPVGLASRRLAIIDLEGGDQPIASEDGQVHVVCNGELYDHRRERAALEARGHRFATRSDSEVLLHRYEDRGLALADGLRGMWAAAVWDARERRLVLTRDPFGIKPLYWLVHDGVLAFGSELRALAEVPGASRELDLDAVEAFLAFNVVPGPLSIYRGVAKLPPGHLLVCQDGEVRVERRERLGPRPRGELDRRPAGELAEELRERLRLSVRAHLESDVPVGVLLSGGVDSSALTALAAQESSARVSTFSLGFEERSFDELDRARLVARRYGTDHHEEVLRPDAAELMPLVAAAFDEPQADSSALATWLVCRLASRHVKVVLSGEGADELFGGYHTYTADQLAAAGGGLAGRLEPLARRLPVASGRVPLDYKLKRFTAGAALAPLERHHAWKEIFSPDARAALLDGRRGALDPVDLLRERYAETDGAPALARMQDLDQLPLVDDLLVKTDRMSMAHSLEARTPFLDRVVHELAAGLPTHLKVVGPAKKRLLRRAVAPLVPRAVVHGRKRGFSIPAAAWLRGDLQPMARDILAPEAVARRGVFSPAAVTRVLDRHVAGEADLSRPLWGLLTFALWQDAEDARVRQEGRACAR